jgi:uncharacterized protein YndB with AHSA1/START domain
MSSPYERTFVVKCPVERAWSAFIEREGREAWMSPPDRDPIENPGIEYPAPGFPKMELKLGKIEENKLLQWSTHHVADDNPGWVETTVTFEEVDSGTRITITRAGFGETPDWLLFKQSSSLGMDHSLIDLVAYLETGVNVSRHFTGMSSIGASMQETPAGIEIVHAVDGGFAAETGMRAGDLLISLADAGVYHRSDIWFIQREHQPGTEVEASFVRDGTLLSGRGRLSEKDYTETHGFGGA